MATQRKQYSAEFKARVALEALKGHKTMNPLVSMYGVRNQVTIGRRCCERLSIHNEKTPLPYANGVSVTASD